VKDAQVLNPAGQGMVMAWGELKYWGFVQLLLTLRDKLSAPVMFI